MSTRKIKTSKVGRYITSQEITQAQNASIRGNKRSKNYAVSLLSEASRQIVNRVLNEEDIDQTKFDRIPPL